MDISKLERLQRKIDFYRDPAAPPWCRTIWSRPEAFENFCKQKRDLLKEAGVLVRVGRDYFVDREQFPPAAASILGVGEADK
jgi:hypothetical protein